MKRQPAQVFHPGEYIEDELIARDWTVGKLADEMKISEWYLNQIINGNRGIARFTAVKLSIAFGTSIELWVNLQAAYDSSVELTKPSA